MFSPLSKLFVTLIFALSAFGTAIKRDQAQVDKDIVTLNTGTKSLDTAIKGLPNSGGTLKQALAIRDAAVKLNSAVQNATTDTTESPAFTDSQSDDIVRNAEALVANVKVTLTDLVNKKDALAGLGVTEIVEDNLKDMQGSAKEFGTALMNKVPASSKTATQEQIDELTDAFEVGVKAYSS